MKPMIAILAFLLTGCIANQPSNKALWEHKTHDSFQQVSKETGVSNIEIARYAARVQNVIKPTMPYSNSSGAVKTCSVRITAMQDGTIKTVTGILGDYDTCNFAVRSLKGIRLPEMSDNEYKVFHQFLLDYRYQ